MADTGHRAVTFRTSGDQAGLGIVVRLPDGSHAVLTAGHVLRSDPLFFVLDGNNQRSLMGREYRIRVGLDVAVLPLTPDEAATAVGGILPVVGSRAVGSTVAKFVGTAQQRGLTLEPRPVGALADETGLQSMSGESGAAVIAEVDAILCVFGVHVGQVPANGTPQAVLVSRDLLAELSDADPRWTNESFPEPPSILDELIASATMFVRAVKRAITG